MMHDILLRRQAEDRHLFPAKATWLAERVTRSEFVDQACLAEPEIVFLIELPHHIPFEESFSTSLDHIVLEFGEPVGRREKSFEVAAGIRPVAGRILDADLKASADLGAFDQ